MQGHKRETRSREKFYHLKTTGCWRVSVEVQDWDAEPPLLMLLQQMLTELH